jgi:hypothetical protein
VILVQSSSVLGKAVRLLGDGFLLGGVFVGLRLGSRLLGFFWGAVGLLILSYPEAA